MKTLLLCLFLVVVHSAPHWKPRLQILDGNIIGGFPAYEGEFPYQLSLQDISFGFHFHFCGAVIYNENWGISAAQCFQGEDVEDPSNIIAVAGELEIDLIEGHEQTIALSHFIQHEDFDGYRRSNDIAVMKMSKTLTFNEFVKPVSLPPANHTATGDCIISGWGTTTEGGISSKVLMKATLPIITDKACRVVYGESLEDTMICAGLPEGGVGGCTADTGGPMVCYDVESPLDSPYLAGIMSWSHGCARPGIPSVYCEVSHYVDWIESHIS
uniref:Putative trypsin n=1 Tax=Crangon crangon TaxID=491138 RepID=A0A2Z4BY85_CRACN|nr:putative trypsin [Crangon crangon]AWU67094.1 putative trypsin [Crangon crangon]